MDTIEDVQFAVLATGPVSGSRMHGERRRVDRPEHVSQELLHLVRDDARNIDPQPDPELDKTQVPFPPVLGLAWGLALSVPLWVIIALIGRAVIG